MKVYVVTKMDHTDCYKHAETDYTIVKITRDKEKAYELAHNQQVKAMCDDCLVRDGESDDKDKDDVYNELPTYIRDEEDESWKVSYGKLIELFYKVLPEPEYTVMVNQVLYSVEEHALD
ncbi:hypothetical protein BGW39_010647 [Mortierella sp. 14UC]|nr:hypothetical protein BGW39_010647 [Mortierella sp. 14UC]